MLKLSSYNGVEFVGVYSKANESIALVPYDSDPSYSSDMEESLGVKCRMATIASTNLLGALVAINSYGVVLTSMATDAEIEALPKDLNVMRLEDKMNAAGNNILVNDNGAVVNPEIGEEFIASIRETLQVEVVKGTAAGYKTIGSVCAATNKGALCHPETKREEFELLRSVLKVAPAIGTLNYGSGMVGASIIANSKGGLVGFRSTPIELGRVEDALHLF